jgi:hypothetical protein
MIIKADAVKRRLDQLGQVFLEVRESPEGKRIDPGGARLGPGEDLLFEKEGGETGPGERVRGGAAARPSPNNHDIIHGGHRFQNPGSKSRETPTAKIDD